MSREVSLLEGKVLVSASGEVGGDTIEFVDTDGITYHIYHSQDCCECVVIDDICGDLQDLVGVPILLAEKVTNKDHPFTGPHGDALLKARFHQGSKLPEPSEYSHESETWTFYRFRTIKGSVDIRWHGSSNGYYSEEVSFGIITGGAIL